MLDEFEGLREKLHQSIEESGLHSAKTVKISKKYNDLVNFHYQNERQYKSDNLMYKKYVESLKHLRKITKDAVEFPTTKQWSQYAKKNDLLNTESLKFISGSSWHDLRNKIYPNYK
mgnify:FL=1